MGACGVPRRRLGVPEAAACRRSCPHAVTALPHGGPCSVSACCRFEGWLVGGRGVRRADRPWRFCDLIGARGARKAHAWAQYAVRHGDPESAAPEVAWPGQQPNGAHSLRRAAWDRRLQMQPGHDGCPRADAWCDRASSSPKGSAGESYCAAQCAQQICCRGRLAVAHVQSNMTRGLFQGVFLERPSRIGRSISTYVLVLGSSAQIWLMLANIGRAV